MVGSVEADVIGGGVARAPGAVAVGDDCRGVIAIVNGEYVFVGCVGVGEALQVPGFYPGYLSVLSIGRLTIMVMIFEFLLLGDGIIKAS